jgi:tRNA pseudouridine38-40 synthase
LDFRLTDDGDIDAGAQPRAAELPGGASQSKIENPKSKMASRCLKLTVAYDGTDFAGWQIQSGQRSVQQTLEQALAKITGQPVTAVGSGRTDSGVHALGQVVSFATESTLSPAVFQRALNAELPPDVVVVDATEAAPGFHARRLAVRKRYRYVLHDGSPHDPFRRRFAWHYRQPLDAAAMATAAAALVGTHDFASFQSTGSVRKSSVRTMYELAVARQPAPDDAFIHIEAEADGFLYNMVRAIVGTLVEVGRGARPVDWPAEVLAARNRAAAGMTAPPHGLALLWVRY